MFRPARIDIDTQALVHNVKRVKNLAPGKKIIAMVKANAYGCGLSEVVTTLDQYVDVFGVACIEEAMAIRKIGLDRACLLCQGVFCPDELSLVASQDFQCVVHHEAQVQWILATPLPKKIKVWIKVNTGMNRIGFACSEVSDILQALIACPWVDNDIGVMTHLARADEPEHPYNQQQKQLFNALDLPEHMTRSMANSAGILAFPEMHFDVVRPGIMLYGISPFSNQIGHDLGLIPVMRFFSKISAIHHYPPHTPIGYTGLWQSDKPTIVGVIAAGYGDGYPRHIMANTPVWVNDRMAPIIGRVSMDMMTVDLTQCSNVQVGDVVELWGANVPVETIAKQAGTNAYELICQITTRVRKT